MNIYLQGRVLWPVYTVLSIMAFDTCYEIAHCNLSGHGSLTSLYLSHRMVFGVLSAKNIAICKVRVLWPLYICTPKTDLLKLTMRLDIGIYSTKAVFFDPYIWKSQNEQNSILLLAHILFLSDDASFSAVNVLAPINYMRTTCSLVKRIILSFIEPIRKSVKKQYNVKDSDATFSKTYFDWLKKLKICDIDR